MTAYEMRISDWRSDVCSSDLWKLEGWITHLACADEPDNDFTTQQIARFDSALAGVPGPRSIANSAGIIAWPGARRDWVRPGLVLYGSSPLSAQSADSLGLRPVMTLDSRSEEHTSELQS